jgi:hypothetical protein
MLDRLNTQLEDVSVGDWKLVITLLLVANSVALGGLGWLVLNQAAMAPPPPQLEARAFAQVPPTRTPLPTFTPTPAPTSTPSPTNTLVPTWTPTPTDTPTITPTPTDTPTSTSTPRPAAPARPAATDTPAPTPTPDVDFVASVRQLTPCENEGKHHLFIYVKDMNGEGMPGVPVRVAWASGEATMVTGEKTHIDPGFVDFAMFKGSYTVQVLGYASQIAGPITPDIPKNETCTATGNGVANSLFHYSYEIVFQKVR